MESIRVLTSFDDTFPEQLVDGGATNGRAVIVADLLSRLRDDPLISDIRSIGASVSWKQRGIAPADHELGTLHDRTPTVWLELGRHNLWPAHVFRSWCGLAVNAVVLAHSVGYSDHVFKNLASLVGFRSGDVVLAPTAAAKQALSEQFNALGSLLPSAPVEVHPQIEVLPWGVPVQPRSEANPPEGDSSTPHLLVLGRYSPQDKLDWSATVEALRLLHRQGVSFSATMVGYDPGVGLPERLRAYFAEHGMSSQVDVAVNVSDRAKETLFASSSILLSLSRTLSESFGLSVVEAMSRGVVPVVSSWGPYREIVRDEVDGKLVQTEWQSDADPSSIVNFYLGHGAHVGREVVINAEAVAQALEALLRDPKHLRALSSNAVSHARTAFSAERMYSGLRRRLFDAAIPMKRVEERSVPRHPFRHYPTLP